MVKNDDAICFMRLNFVSVWLAYFVQIGEKNAILMRLEFLNRILNIPFEAVVFC